MRQDTLSSPPGSRKRRIRVGRGSGSRHGDYSGRGMKGQKSRTGGGTRRGFEGGQLPLIRRMPSQRGFTNIFRREFSEVNVGQLQEFAAGTEVTLETLKEHDLIKSLDKHVKVLGYGELSVALTIKAHKFSAGAKSKIEAAGGQAEEIKE